MAVMLELLTALLQELNLLSAIFYLQILMLLRFSNHFKRLAYSGFLHIKTHGMCCAAQENRACANGVSVYIRLF